MCRLEPTQSSETSAYIIRTPGKFPKEYLLRSEYFQYSEDASIDEDLELMYDGFSKLPGFTAINQDGFYVGITQIM